MSKNHLPGDSDMSAAISAGNILDSIIAFGVIAADLNGVIVHWNEGAKRIFGWTAEEMLGQPVSRLFAVDIHGRVETSAEVPNPSLLERSLGEGWLVRKNGEQFWTSSELVPMRSSSMELLGYVKVLRDQTSEQVSDTDTLRESLSPESGVCRYTANARQSIWDNSLDLIALLTPEGVIDNVNPAWTNYLGWLPSDVLGRQFQTLVHPDSAKISFAKPSNVWRKKLIKYENRYRHKDGSYRRILWTFAAFENFVLARGTAVSAEKTQQEIVPRAEDALEQAQKLEVALKLTDGIAHDFNNMLAGILGNLEMLQLRIGQGNFRSAPRYIDAAVEVANRASALTHRLLSFSRQQALDPKPTNVKDLVEEMTELLKRTLGANVSVEIVAVTDSVTVLCDANQLESAILNLALNSRDAMPHGGHFTIKIANKTLAKAAESLSSDLEPGEYVEITVRDTGVGMLPDVRRRSLDPFFTTKALGQGMGLGLPTVYSFVKQSKGHLYIDSKTGAGTSVHILLPSLSAIPQPPKIVSNIFKFPQTPRHVSILLAEDDATVRKIAYEVLTDLGYTVAQAGDAGEALTLLETMSDIDLLITESKLPNGINGLQLAVEVKKKYPHLPVVFLTDILDVALPGGELINENVEIVTKPFSVRVFAAKIQSIIDRY